MQIFFGAFFRCVLLISRLYVSFTWWLSANTRLSNYVFYDAKTNGFPHFVLLDHSPVLCPVPVASNVQNCIPIQVPKNVWIHNENISGRGDIGLILEECGLKTGAEIGVHQGGYAEEILKRWKQCTTYYLVDPWKQQKNYKDHCNVIDKDQEESYKETKNRLSPWHGKTVYYRMISKEAVSMFADNSLDFIYIDARHDYCAVKEDIEMYWPKLRCGGILAGHDYNLPEEGGAGQDLNLCENGERHEGGTKRAVNEFVEKHKLKLTVTHDWAPSWLVTKPIA